MSDTPADEVDVRRLARSVIPIRAAQGHDVPERPYNPVSPWAVDSFRHHRVLQDESEDDEWIGATAQSGHRPQPYRCSLCHAGLTPADIDIHNCQGEFPPLGE